MIQLKIPRYNVYKDEHNINTHRHHNNHNVPPLNPSTTTRATYTAKYTERPPPPIPNADPKWTRLLAAAIALFKALGEDESMARNSLQTFDTPAIDKNAQYFAWDFVMRTIVRSPHPSPPKRYGKLTIWIV